MYHIDCITDNDFSEVTRIFLQTFPRTDDADFANAWRTKECNYSLGLYYKATLVGFAITCLEVDATAPAARLWFIAVDPKQRSGGAGTQLLTSLIDACCANGLRLILTPDNSDRVISWYKRHGFIITKIMPFVHKDIPTHWMEWRSDDDASAEAEAQSPTTLSTESVRGSPIHGGSFSSDCSLLELENTDG
jgi:ribosomal protein S18 acetylase RimI-like enzyme